MGEGENGEEERPLKKPRLVFNFHGVDVVEGSISKADSILPSTARTVTEGIVTKMEIDTKTNEKHEKNYLINTPNMCDINQNCNSKNNEEENYDYADTEKRSITINPDTVTNTDRE